MNRYLFENRIYKSAKPAVNRADTKVERYIIINILEKAMKKDGNKDEKSGQHVRVGKTDTTIILLQYYLIRHKCLKHKSRLFRYKYIYFKYKSVVCKL